MAFVSQTSRKLSTIEQATCQLGPGEYFREQTVPLKHDIAPFKTTSKRRSLLSPNRQVQPGPGNYEVTQPFIEPNVKTVSNAQSIIVKINSTGTAQFKSTVERFANHQLEGRPGPAQYCYSGANVGRKKWHSLSAVNRKNYEPKPKKNNPTIPERVRGLADSKKEQLPSEGKLGPAFYHPKKFEMTNLRSTVWGKDKSRRFSLDDQSEVGPGKYTPNLQAIKYDEQPTFHFKSNTVRTYFDSLIYNTNVDETAKIRDIDHYKSKQPAPGQYQPNYSSLKVEEKPFEFQFFGSTVERFPQNEPSAKTSKSFYNIKSCIGQNRSFNKVDHAFLSDSERKPEFLRLHENEQMPGPGQYEQMSEKKQHLHKLQQFGSNSARMFQKEEVIDEVGPGRYIKEPQENICNNLRYNQFNELSSNFKSASNRNCFGEPKEVGGSNPFGEYDVSQFDIAKKAEKQKNFIDNLKKIDVEKPPFESNNVRFPHYEKNVKISKKMLLEETRVQELQIIEAENRKREIVLEANLSQCKSSRKNYFGNEERFRKSKKLGPPVGEYSLRSAWEKKSHNIKYCHM